jgi:hypothetical protein
MTTQATKDQTENLLDAYLKEKSDAAAENLLVRLVYESASPTIKTIIRNKLQVSLSESDGSQQNQDALEVDSEVKAQLIAELRAVKTDPQKRAINNFRSYVAVITFHSCYEYLRRKYPQRASLKDKLRHLLNNHADFNLWESIDKSSRELVCGFDWWQKKGVAPAQAVHIERIREDPTVLGQISSNGNLQNSHFNEMLTSIFNYAGGPIKLDNLVNIVAHLYDIKDQLDEANSDEEERQRTFESIPDTRVNVALEVEQRIYLQRLWKEICELPLKQRMALLLNLRDANGRSVLMLLPHSRVATIRQIAEALEMSAEKFASIYVELPLDDATIAEHLGIPRQQVINLRLSARERLTRRMKAIEKGA